MVDSERNAAISWQRIRQNLFYVQPFHVRTYLYNIVHNLKVSLFD